VTPCSDLAIWSDQFGGTELHPARTERNTDRLAAGGGPRGRQDVKHAVATLTGVVAHEDPMALTGTVVYTPQESCADFN
jgi:hypothetical protein